jgi:AcrR family transcriptional regulator
MVAGLRWAVNRFIVSINTKGEKTMTVLGRPRTFDREAALDAAMLVFWRKGFQAASMNDLCEAMGIRSPSLYAAFGSKESLYQEAVQRYHGAARARIWDHIAGGTTVRAGMNNALLAAAEVLLGDADRPSGCLVTLAAGEECDGTAPEIGRLGRLEGLNVVRAAIAGAVASGELSKSTNVDRLSRFYLGVVQAMAIQARDGASHADLKSMAKMAMAAWPAD